MRPVRKFIYNYNEIPKTSKGFSWKDSVGCHIGFTNGSFSGKIKIIDYSVKGKTQVPYLTVEYLGKTKQVGSNQVKNGRGLNSLLMPKIIKTAYIGDIVGNEKKKFIVTGIMSRKIKDKTDTVEKAFYKVKCLKCKKEYIVDLNFLSYPYCRVCAGFEVLYGYNDITTTDPWMIPYFESESEAKKYMSGTEKSIIPKCPKCGRKHDKEVRVIKLKKQGFRCKYCNDNTPMTEKVIISLLDYVGIPYIHLARNKVLPFNAKNKEYDFYLPTLSCIVEVNGKQHYKDSLINGYRFVSAKEVKKNDKYKYELAKGSIEHYIVIDCSKSDFDYIKKSIIKSGLLKILDISSDEIDWGVCKSGCIKTLQEKICSDYKNNYMTVKELAKKYGKSHHTVYDALKFGNDIGICTYKGHAFNTHLNPVELLIDNDHIAFGKSLCELSKKLRQHINPHSFNYNALQSALINDNLYLNKYTIRYVNDVDLKWDIINGLYDDELTKLKKE